MSYYKFEKNDIFRNRIKTHPRVHFLINDTQTYYNNRVLPLSDAAFSSNPQGTETVQNTAPGHLSLHELNINRDPGVGGSNLIYPYVTKQGSLESFKTVSTESFQNFQYSDKISGSYPMSASISTDYYGANTPRARIMALKNTFNYYKPLSVNYSFLTADWDKGTQEIKLVSVPSIFYGSSIKKGTVDIKFYITGSLVGRLQDTGRNGDLIQTLPDDENKGKCAGVVLYTEGFAAITGSWDITPTHTEDYLVSGVNIAPKWTYWGQKDYISPSSPISFTPSSSWDITAQGTNYIPTLTMLAHAKQGDLNHSNNPTYTEFDSSSSIVTTPSENTDRYVENSQQRIANIVKSEHPNTSGSFEKTTYISKIGIYDEDKNLIAIAKLATPVKKTESRQYTFKMKIDF